MAAATVRRSKQEFGEEPLIRLVDVPHLKWLPAGRGKTGRLHYTSVLRWALAGLGGEKLKAVRVGGTWCTTASWLHGFFADVAAARSKLKPPSKTAAQAETEKKLKAAGAM